MALTPEQLRAATAPASASVTAGAGTGKTLMLAERYLHHVAADGLSPLSVVAVTFTEKAANELRSRIRKRLREALTNETVIAEVEAAQISTIHSLAARVCRDFYDLAGIPADFVILDETDQPLWLAEKFDQAVAQVDRSLIDELGFTWMITALRRMLDDPIASAHALSLGSGGWKDAIRQVSAEAAAELVSHDAWRHACEMLPDCCGAEGDKLEEVRRAVARALSIEDHQEAIRQINGAFYGFNKRWGVQRNWDKTQLADTRECLAALRDLIKEKAEFALLEFGPNDEETARRLPMLHKAFDSVTRFLAEEKKKEKILDFSDLEYYALRALANEAAREHYAKRWRAFLVDEFQDTNPAEAAILERLTRNATITIVGDEKQSIYAFRGADVDVFAEMRTRITKTPAGIDVPLNKTFRSHAEIVASTNRIFEAVLETQHQELVAHRDTSSLQGPFVRMAVVDGESGLGKGPAQVIEARWIAERVQQLHRDGVAYRDIAIMARRWAPLDAYMGVLSAYGIPAVNVGGGSLLETREAKDIYALMSFLAEPEDDIPLVALLRSPFFAVSDRVLQETAPGLDGRSWWSAVRESSKFQREVGVLEQLLGAAKTHSASQVLAFAEELTGYSAVMANLVNGARREADIQGMKDLLRRFERNGRGDIFGTARSLRDLEKAGTWVPRLALDAEDAVTLVSIHRAKGLEWPVVFVGDLAAEPNIPYFPVIIDKELGVSFQTESDTFEKNQPAIYKLMKLRRLQRERDELKRLLYVALTRAKDMLFLTATSDSPRYTDREISILRPGLGAAGIEIESIPFEPEQALAPSPAEPAPFELPQTVLINDIPRVLREVPVTGLTAYARCPKQFEYQYVLGHPGLGEGFARARTTGTLTHEALELDITDIERLRPLSPDASDEILNEALALAATFRSSDKFAEFRKGERRSEFRFAHESEGIRLIGVADLVGKDFVLDFKTDSAMHPEEHRFQLWAYQRALEKPRALIAYLRQDKVHEWTAAELTAIDADAKELVNRIRSGDYAATPSAKECSRCQFNSICPARAAAEPDPEPTAEPEPVQLGFAF
ncbi:MAG: UvrD-helicase domain-containing protein [Acidobacteria bacterium]|nr:UvrD-helicase domain-containing protein [Acidobacteriota bacterium]